MHVEMSADLTRVCEIVGERNMLQGERQRARSRLAYLQTTYRYRRALRRYREAERLADPRRNTKLKKLLALREQYTALNMGDIEVRSALENAINRTKNEIAYNADRFKHYAKPYKNERVSNSLLNMSTRKLLIMLKQAQVQQMQAEIALHLHSERTTKELRAILRKNDWWLRYNGSNMVRCVMNRSNLHPPEVIADQNDFRRVFENKMVDRVLTSN